ncbi:MAG: ATP phosphoribosyltransferase regulatory subunit [Halocynthiibacter sp.]
MTIKSAVRSEAIRLRNMMEANGASVIEADILQPAGTLLDLYGEDIRSRAFVTMDPLHGECMLRPDFTVPVVEAHMRDGAEPARYTYAGEVFRHQDDDFSKQNEYLQVGYEVFDRSNPNAADAEVFALFQELLSPLNLRAATGDIGILMAAVKGLPISDHRKTALLRHIWRPVRFRSLLDRYAGKAPVPKSRVDLLQSLKTDTVSGLISKAGPAFGVRRETEIEARIQVLQEDAQEPPISANLLDLLGQILAVRETCTNALEQLRDIAVDMPWMLGAVENFVLRLDALSDKGVDVDALEFEASYGRTTMEYYDGFVFGFYAQSRPDLPPVATGGRYDALTERLGEGRSIPAVGGVIRPALVLDLKGENQ